MHVDPKGKQSSHLKSFFVLALVLSTLLIAVVGTTAWLRYIRSLQTVARVHVTELYLKGPTDKTIAIDLGSIDTSENGPARYVFGVKSNNVDKFWVQLGYTTNIKLSYTICQSSEPNESRTDESDVQIGDSYFTRGAALDDQVDVWINKEERHDLTYGTGFSRDQVQSYAEPLYCQYGPIDIEIGQTLYFILEISWGSGVDNDKETDMIYLTVGTSGLTGVKNESGGN